MTTATEIVGISLEDTIPVERQFVGEITQDEILEGNYGPQWHLVVQPFDYPDAKPLHAYPAIKRNEAGKLVLQGEFGRTTAALRDVFGTKDEQGNALQVGAGLLVGRVAFFAHRVLTYGKDRDTGETIRGKRASLIALRKPTDADLAGVQSDAAPQADTTRSNMLTEDQLVSAFEVMVGKDKAAYLKGLMKNPDLDKATKDAIVSGAAVEQLTLAGHARLDDSGVLWGVEAPAAA